MCPIAIIIAAVSCTGFVKATHAEPDLLDGWDLEWGVIDLPWEALPAASDATTTTTSSITAESTIVTGVTNLSVLTPPPRFKPSCYPAALTALEILFANPDITLGPFVSSFRRVRVRTSVKQARALYQSLLSVTTMPQWFHTILVSRQPISTDLLSQISSRIEREEGARPTDLARWVDVWRNYCIMPMITDHTVCVPKLDARGTPIVQLSRAQRQRLYADMLQAEPTSATTTTTTTSPPLNTSEDKVWELDEISHFFSSRQLRDILPPRMEPRDDQRAGDREQPLESPMESPSKRIKASEPDHLLSMSPAATLTTTTAVPPAAVARARLVTLSFTGRLAVWPALGEPNRMQRSSPI